MRITRAALSRVSAAFARLFFSPTFLRRSVELQRTSAALGVGSSLGSTINSAVRFCPAPLALRKRKNMRPSGRRLVEPLNVELR
jgi:hypothetical protein